MTRSLITGKVFIGWTVMGSSIGKRVHARLAGEAWAAVDFRRAGAALAGFAIPAHGEIRRLMRLNIVQRVEHDHSRSDRAPGSRPARRRSRRRERLRRIASAIGYSSRFSSAFRLTATSSREFRTCHRAIPRAELFRVCKSFVHRQEWLIRALHHFIASPSRMMMLFCLPQLFVELGKIDAAVRAAAFLAGHGARSRLRKQSASISDPARCQPGLNMREPSTLSCAARAFNICNSVSAALQIFFDPKDSDQALHDCLQIAMNGVGIFAALRQRARAILFRLPAICALSMDAVTQSFRMRGRSQARRAAQKPANRKANFRPGGSRRASPAAASPAAKNPGTVDCRGFRFHADAAHHVVAGRAQLPWAPW